MKYFYKKIMPINSLRSQIQLETFSYSQEWSEESEKEKLNTINPEKEDENLTQESSKKKDFMQADFAITMTVKVVVTASIINPVVAE